MIVAAKLEMPDFEQALEMKVLDWEIFQAASEGLEYGRPKLRDIRFTFYDSKLVPYFFEWAKGSNSKRSGKIEYISSDMGKVEYSFSFEDAVCSACNVHYNKNEELSLFCEVSLSVSLQKQDLVKGKGEKAKQIVAAPIEQTDEIISEIMEIYYMDLDGKRISSLSDKKVKVVIKTSNMVGDLIDIDFKNNEFDFKYKGEVLVDDMLKDYKIMTDSDEIELEVFDQLD